MTKIDARLTEKAETVEAGFQTVVGHVWELLNKNTAMTVDWLRPIFLPLVMAAASVDLYV
jgi:hypothetical protein